MVKQNVKHKRKYKFCMLRALKNKTALAVTRALFELFGLFGAPKILQSDNGKEFRNGFINALINVWPQMKIIHGRARFPQAQGSSDLEL